MKRRGVCILLISITVLFLGVFGSVYADIGDTIRVSVASDGSQATDWSNFPDISADGHYIVFQSDANDLVSDDTRGFRDIFVHNYMTGETIRVSVDSEGNEANNDSSWPSISANGQFVTFASKASNLVNDDTAIRDIFIHDLKSGETELISVTEDTSPTENTSTDSSVSADGRYVAFSSNASNLVTGDTNDDSDIFLRDRTTGITTRISVSSEGTQAIGDSYDPSISYDGKVIAFQSLAENLVDNDDNNVTDIFVHYMQTGDTIRVSVDSVETQANGSSTAPSLSGNGQIVAFLSAANNLVSGDSGGFNDIFIHNLNSHETKMVSLASNGDQANGHSLGLSISSNGNYIAFASDAINLATGDDNGKQDIFVHNVVSGETIRVSVSSSGVEAHGDSSSPAISGNGGYVVFESIANDLVINDTNGDYDIFLHELSVFQTYLPLLMKFD